MDESSSSISISIPIPISISTPTPTQAELVRALESIDDAVLASAHHHANGQTDHHIHEELDHDMEVHPIADVEGEQHANKAIDAANSILPQPYQDVPAQTQAPSMMQQQEEGGDKQLTEWSREELQAEVLRLRSLVRTRPSRGPAMSSTPDPASAVTSQQSSLSTSAALPLGTPDSTGLVGLPDTSRVIDPTLEATHSGTSMLKANENTATPGNSKKRSRRNKNDIINDGSSTDKGDAEASAAGRIKRSSKKSKIVKLGERDAGTGKRLEKERRTELGRVIRTKIRSSIGVALDAILPHPINQLDPITGVLTFVPDWSLALNDQTNAQWVNNIVQGVFEEASAGLHPKIPSHDISSEIIEASTKTAFLNMCKRYANENDPKGVERREKYTKKRRRWARKDLKQKRRFRSSTDPSFADLTVPPSAMNIDYMSSEYSSSGEEDDVDNGEILIERKSQWADMRNKQESESSMQVKENVGGKGGWAVGVSEKVLEVRTPRWRSEALNDIYRRLDAYANEQADTRATGGSSASASSAYALSSHPGTAGTTDESGHADTIASSASTATPLPKPGHVAPSHRRFVMPPHLMREGKAPRNLGEGWMWASGEVGVWPKPGSPAERSASSSAATAVTATFQSIGRLSGSRHAISSIAEDGGQGGGDSDIPQSQQQVNDDGAAVDDSDSDKDQTHNGITSDLLEVGDGVEGGPQHESGDIDWPTMEDDHVGVGVGVATLGDHDLDHTLGQGQVEGDSGVVADDADVDIERDREEAHRLGLVSALEGL
ncbi:hypothetical protein I316_03104 [Kwoniella heveanensis BCC8398]|uniref:Uncharacterized protein n=1 Tax=Kwoniella heveanensis BCC8398 TaxID=1296120 RepID=A0A1B9GVK1_9TREE|nr:hypothetical protein I316_03104 [Kwoniella heveanensis BCC8398]